MVLYLPGEQLSQSTGGTVTGVRYYDLPGGGTAYRTGTGTAYGFEIDDQHGTNSLLLNYTASVPTWRQFTPFGATRGTAAAWVDNRTFLNAPPTPPTG
jgi:hypothetical protein